jgi:hypothetical protein
MPLLAVAALSIAGVSAQAATTAGPASHTATVQHAAAAPDFTCPSRSVCLFPNDDWAGNYPGGAPVVLPTDVYNGAWLTFASVGASNPNPGSLNDNSNSVMWIHAADAGTYKCLTPSKWILFHSWGWFFIQFGVTSCPAHHPAGP